MKLILTCQVGWHDKRNQFNHMASMVSVGISITENQLCNVFCNTQDVLLNILTFFFLEHKIPANDIFFLGQKNISLSALNM
jgi:hypothetical protein